MLNGKTVAVVVPAYNEETQIGIVIDTMPNFVDRIIVVNDASTDKTAEIVKQRIAGQQAEVQLHLQHVPTEIEPAFFNRAEVILAQMRREEEALYPAHTIYNDNAVDRLVLLENTKNSKVGNSMKVGYKWCRDHAIDCTAIMAGDAQMDPSELESICLPVVGEGIDYVKGNRLSHPAAKRMIPKKRYFGNSVLSALTKIATGYWRISDTQTGYTAISLRALNAIDLHKIYPQYGVPNDILLKLNVAKCTLREVPIKPVYDIGEKSKMKIGKVVPTVSWLLLTGYYKRIFKKYLVTDFHPIFLFSALALVCTIFSLYFLVLIVAALAMGQIVTVGTYIGFIAFLVTALLTTGFGMWFDMDDNDRLQQ